jgi:hypothetical protein
MSQSNAAVGTSISQSSKQLFPLIDSDTTTNFAMRCDAIASFDSVNLKITQQITKTSSSSSPLVVKLVPIDRRNATFVFLTFDVL